MRGRGKVIFLEINTYPQNAGLAHPQPVILLWCIRQPFNKCFNKYFENLSPAAQPGSKNQISSNHISACKKCAVTARPAMLAAALPVHVSICGHRTSHGWLRSSKSIWLKTSNYELNYICKLFIFSFWKRLSRRWLLVSVNLLHKRFHE